MTWTTKLRRSYHRWMKDRDLRETLYARWLDAMAALRKARRRAQRKL